jgi:GNAT superfamily N-acetyltransferase
VPLDWGTALAHPAVPSWPDLNVVRVEVPVPDLDAAQLERVVERLQRELPLRRIEVLDEATGERLAGELDDGWERSRSVVMRWGGDEPPAERHAVAEVAYARVARLREEWMGSEPWAAQPGLLEALLATDELFFGANPMRAFASEAGGAPVAYGLLLDSDGSGVIDDVYTTPQARGSGRGASVVSRLVRESRAAGHETTILLTDADGRARDMYARLGFEPLGLVHRFTRRLG